MKRHHFVGVLLLLSVLVSDFQALADSPSHSRLSQELMTDIETWQALARQGDADAMFNLGQLFRRGIGIEADIHQAKLFYEQAAALGHSGAQLNLGTLYYFGPDNPNIEQAAYWWQQAAEQGEGRAQYQLALLYLNLPEPDLLESLAWMTLAQQSGDVSAVQALPQLRSRLPESVLAALPQRLAEMEPRKVADSGADDAAVYRVQLASLSDQAAAVGMLQQLRRDYPGLLAPLLLKVRSVELEGKEIYRVHAGAFTKRADADALCGQLKARGQGCFVVEIQTLVV
ncbi:hypothetical protein CFI10_15720 [Marinobacterium iners]|uniref:SPOR domain-containing protein n=1 Tax=Marinobacterium iners TaxID=48076 RepID=UPI001A8C76FB|nr:SPOR domain-containing protein [Marinobacterium iners]QSR36401.1 hypothetical protein CFI10_15720 [Marinobacterium iners]